MLTVYVPEKCFQSSIPIRINIFFCINSNYVTSMYVSFTSVWVKVAIFGILFKALGRRFDYMIFHKILSRTNLKIPDTKIDIPYFMSKFKNLHIFPYKIL